MFRMVTSRPLPSIAAAYYREGLMLALTCVASLQHTPEEIAAGDEELTNLIVIKLCEFLDSGDDVAAQSGYKRFFDRIHDDVRSILR